MPGKFKRDRRELAIDVASTRRERQKRLAQIGPVYAPGHQLAALQHGNRARHLGLVHVTMDADGFCRHGAELAEGHQHAPFRNANFVALGINPRERLRHKAGADIQTIGQKFFQLERDVVVRRAARSVGSLIGHMIAAAFPRARRVGAV